MSSEHDCILYTVCFIKWLCLKCAMRKIVNVNVDYELRDLEHSYHSSLSQIVPKLPTICIITMCGNHIAKRGIWLSVSKVGCEEKTSRPLAGAHGTNSTNGRSSVPHYGGSGCSGNPTPMHQLNKSQKVPILHIPLCFSGIKLGSQTLRFAEALEVWFSGLRLLHSFWSAFGGCEICCTRQFHTCGMERTAKPLFTLTYS